MNIEGSLISDGTLQGMAGGKAGIIDVSGAKINGSTVIAKNLLPDSGAGRGIPVRSARREKCALARAPLCERTAFKTVAERVQRD